MGKIWLTTTSGRKIHIPVSGPDINTPDDPIEIPTSVVDVNRCVSQQQIIVSPTHGTFTIDFMQDSGLTGGCNQCGQCCGHPAEECDGPDGECGWPLNLDVPWHTCQYLMIDKKNKWGDPNNSECSLYATILDSFKGCLYPPRHIKSWMTSCGYTEV